MKYCENYHEISLTSSLARPHRHHSREGGHRTLGGDNSHIPCWSSPISGHHTYHNSDGRELVKLRNLSSSCQLVSKFSPSLNILIILQVPPWLMICVSATEFPRHVERQFFRQKKSTIEDKEAIPSPIINCQLIVILANTEQNRKLVWFKVPTACL